MTSRRRRWSAAVAIMVIASTLTASAVATAEPEDVIAGYLDLVKAGDAEGALAHTRAVGDLHSASTALLTSDALGGDWSVTGIARRYGQADDPVTVDVTITAADGTAREGRFEMERRDGVWTILNPLVKVSLDAVPMDYASFNGVMTPDRHVWLFPGSYQPYRELAGMLAFDEPSYVAVPVPSLADAGRAATEQPYAPAVTVAEDHGTSVIDAGLAAWVDECAASTALEPENCPMAAAFRDDTVVLEDGYYHGVEGVAWEVVTYPRARLAYHGGNAFVVLTIVPGEVRVSGEGDTYETYEEVDVPFSGECGVQLARTTAVMRQDGTLAFQSGSVISSCEHPYLYL